MTTRPQATQKALRLKKTQPDWWELFDGKRSTGFSIFHDPDDDEEPWAVYAATPLPGPNRLFAYKTKRAARRWASEEYARHGSVAPPPEIKAGMVWPGEVGDRVFFKFKGHSVTASCEPTAANSSWRPSSAIRWTIGPSRSFGPC